MSAQITLTYSSVWPYLYCASVHCFILPLIHNFSPAYKAMIAKSGDDKPRFSFAKQAGTDNYKKWVREMWYFLESIGLWDHTLLDIENPKPVSIILKGEDLKDDAKLEHQEKCADKIYAWTKNNAKCKDYISCMCLGHIQQEFQAVKTDWLAHNFWEWLKKRYTLQNTVSK